MLRYFPSTDVEITHNKRDYAIIAFAFIMVTLCFSIDSVASLGLQLALGIAGWLCLIALLYGEDQYVRTQIAVAVIFATIGEHFASIYMAGYSYRLENIPAFVPPGHGIVYLTAVATGRCGFFQRYARKITLWVVLIGGLWAILALTSVLGREDQIGALLFSLYCIFLFTGRSPMVYLGAFFITGWVEIVGTALGTWNWAAIDPASMLKQGNPPSGVAAWYCLVDAVAMGCAAPVINGYSKILVFLGFKDIIKKQV